jgi:hypothetical protein
MAKKRTKRGGYPLRNHEPTPSTRIDALAVKVAALERELDAKWQNLKGEIAGLRSLCKETIEACNRDEFATAKAVYRLIEAAHKAEKGRRDD